MNRFVVVMLLCFITIGVVGCNAETNLANNEYTDTVYLANSAKNGLVAVQVDLMGNSVEDKITSIINILKSGNEQGKSSVPVMVNVVSMKLDEKNVVLSFDETYSEMTPVEEILCRSSIVKSITELEGIDGVEFYIGSVPYQNADGTVLGAMGPEDVVLDFTQTQAQIVKKNVTLYYADQAGEFLVPVEYEVALNSDEQIEMTILNLLIQGPEDLTLVRTIPEVTKVKNVYINEGVCYVDLNEEFVTKHMGGSTAEMLTIYSIVNTLTDLDNINKVQFLIEGSKRPEFKGHIEFDVLFQRNLDIIKK